MRKISGLFGAVVVITTLLGMMLAAAIAAPAQNFATLYSFCSQPGVCTDGAEPVAPLIQGIDGNLYGTTPSGGATNWGTVFRITPGGTLTTLYSFCATSACADGSAPVSGLLLASDGSLYGTTLEGGAGSCPNGCGTVFRITLAGALTVLHSFEGSDGSGPRAGLVQAIDGNFYG